MKCSRKFYDTHVSMTKQSEDFCKLIFTATITHNTLPLQEKKVCKLLAKIYILERQSAMTLPFPFTCLMSKTYPRNIKLHLSNRWFLALHLWIKIRGYHHYKKQQANLKNKHKRRNGALLTLVPNILLQWCSSSSDSQLERRAEIMHCQ